MKRLIWTMAIATGCAGADGADGEDGRDGSDGESPEISTRAASEDDCPSGGSEIELDGETIVLCNGEDGEQGPAGEQGEQGPAGEGGSEADGIGRIVLTMFCSGGLADTGSMYATHSIVVFGDGSLWVAASITDGVFQSSDSRFFAPEQLGAATAEVVVTYDPVPPGIGGYWVFNVDPVTYASTIEYFDVDWTGETLWQMQASDCTVNEY